MEHVIVPRDRWQAVTESNRLLRIWNPLGSTARTAYSAELRRDSSPPPRPRVALSLASARTRNVLCGSRGRNRTHAQLLNRQPVLPTRHTLE